MHSCLVKTPGNHIATGSNINIVLIVIKNIIILGFFFINHELLLQDLYHYPR